MTHLVLCLALMFWPSGGDEGATPTFGEPPRKSNQPPPRPQAASVAADRISRAMGAQFGRRAF
jgi:hypothetical protein